LVSTRLRRSLPGRSRGPATRYQSRSLLPRERWSADDLGSCPKTLLASIGSAMPSTFHRVVQRSPLHRHHAWSPLPHTRGCTSVQRYHATALGPPPWFLPTLTVSSSTRSRACCIPQPTMRFIGFRLLPARLPAVGRLLPLRCSTLQSVPLPSSRGGVAATPCLLAVTDCDVGPTSRPCSTRESVA
jgi:hypothetical protein